MTNVENHDMIPTSEEQNKKTTRRWRNSISWETSNSLSVA
jgi:hypothetical protein